MIRMHRCWVRRCKSLILEAIRGILIKFPAVVLTLANTWPLAALSEESSLAVAAQVHGDVREWHECPVPEAVTPSQ
jgi:hypothetical protein